MLTQGWSGAGCEQSSLVSVALAQCHCLPLSLLSRPVWFHTVCFLLELLKEHHLGTCSRVALPAQIGATFACGKSQAGARAGGFSGWEGLDGPPLDDVMHW